MSEGFPRSAVLLLRLRIMLRLRRTVLLIGLTEELAACSRRALLR